MPIMGGWLQLLSCAAGRLTAIELKCDLLLEVTNPELLHLGLKRVFCCIGFAESPVNQVVSKRMVKQQQMLWPGEARTHCCKRGSGY
jgi:hypothetical protein